jgi:VWFA-related protein
MAKKHAVILCLTLSFLFPAHPCAQQSGGSENQVIKADVKLVQVPVVVFGPKGEVVIDLKCENFRLYVDGVEQKISNCLHDPVPLAIAIVVDLSSSMRPYVTFLQEAVYEALDEPQTDNQLHREVYRGDKFMVITFASRASLKIAFTSDREEVKKQLPRVLIVDTKGTTALYDALYLGVKEVQAKAGNIRRVVIVVTDGVDNHSRYKPRDIRAMLKEVKDTQVFSITAVYDFFLDLLHAFDGRVKVEAAEYEISEKERQGPKVLKNLTEAAGGEAFNAYTPGDIPRIVRSILYAARHEYYLTFVPEDEESGQPADIDRTHKIKVVLVPEDKYGRVKGYQVIPGRRSYYRPGK